VGYLRRVLHVGGGLPVLRAPGRTVDLDRHPAGGGARPGAPAPRPHRRLPGERASILGPETARLS